MNMLKNSLTDSKFHMWRACIAVIHLDREVTPEEREWAEEKIKFIPFSKEQEDILRNDLDSGVSLSELIPKITEKKDLAFLLHQLRTIGHMDGDFSEQEKEAFDKLESAILNNLDLASLEAQVQQMEWDSYKEDEYYKSHTNSKFEKLARATQKFMNPGDSLLKKK